MCLRVLEVQVATGILANERGESIAFTVNREQVVGLCKLIIESGLKIRWTCNSRVDYVDEEMLTLMGEAGCWMISWGIESGNEAVLKKAAKGANPAKAIKALTWARNAGIKNWGYFIIGLPGETVETIRETIELSKKLHEEILGNAEDVLKALGLPYRVVTLSAGDMGRSAALTYDIETWMPGRGEYGETHSASRYYDYQARRLGRKVEPHLKGL